jgi:pilus assembly protein Flp/PilA
MKKLILQARSALRRDEGAALAEYSLLVGLIAVICVAAVTLLGQNLVPIYNALAAAF